MTRANRLSHPGGGTGKYMELRSLEFNNLCRSEPGKTEVYCSGLTPFHLTSRFSGCKPWRVCTAELYVRNTVKRTLMKYYFLLFLTFFITSIFGCASKGVQTKGIRLQEFSTMVFSGKPDITGKKVRFEISLENVKSSPDWSPGVPPPTTIQEAVELAEQELLIWT